jgi:hypothetical protein
MLILIKSLLLKVRLFLLSVFSESAFYSCLAHSPDALNELRMRGKKSTRSIMLTSLKGQYQEKYERNILNQGVKNYNF